MSRKRFPLRGVYAITDCQRLDADALLSTTRLLLQGGIAALQYRNKEPTRIRGMDCARALRALCRDAGVPFIVNDDLDMVRSLGADGIHLGREDISPAVARTVLGEQAIIGLSCYADIQQTAAAAAAGIDYVALGAFYASSSKRTVCRVDPECLSIARRETDLPIVAIGGVTPGNGRRLLAAGADVLAVIAGLYQSPRPAAALAAYQALFACHEGRSLNV